MKALSLPFHSDLVRLTGYLTVFGLFLMGVFPAIAQILPRKGAVTQLPGGQNLYTIRGKVLAYGDHGPLQGATVTLRDFKGAGLKTSFTDDEGSFFFYDVAEGRYLLVASHVEYGEQSRQVDLYGGGLQDVRIVLSKKQGAQKDSSDTHIPVWAVEIPPEAKEEYGKALDKLGEGEVKAAIAHLQAATRLYPQYATAYSKLGSAHLQRGKEGLAETAYKKALEIDKNLPEACLGLGSIYSSQGRAEEAESYLLRARRLRANDWRAHFELGRLYYRVQAWPRAEESLQRALEINSEFPRTHLFLMNALAYEEKYAEALAVMKNFLDLFPQNAFASQVREKRDLLQREIKKSPSKQRKRPQ